MRKNLFPFLTAFFCVLFFTPFLRAATITPVTFADSFDMGACSLRDAVQSINTMGDFGGCVGVGAYGASDTIALQAGTYTLTIPGNNEDDNETGDLDVFGTLTPVTINGAGSDQTIIDASAIQDRAIHFRDVVLSASLSGLRIIGGDVSTLDQSGGGIFANTVILNLNDIYLLNNFANAGGGLSMSCSANIVNSVIEGNQALAGMIVLPVGGGILITEEDYCGSATTTTIENSWIIGNLSEEMGGGIGIAGGPDDFGMEMSNSTVDGNMAVDCGGGIATFGTVAITHSTISRNESQTAGGGICDFFSGAYFFLTNTTVSHNQADTFGGGIASSGGLKGMYNVTVAFNQVNGVGGGGGGVFRGGGQTDDRFDTQVFNTIIANNMAELGPDCFGVLDSGGNNLIGNIGAAGDCIDSNLAPAFAAPGDQAGAPGSPIDPQLGPLQLNGGTTETHALALTSPAVDTGNNVTGCQALDTALFFDTDTLQFNTLTDDQRFLTRPVGILDPNNPICDIGAFELQASSPPPPPITDEFVQGSGGCSLNSHASSPGYFVISLFLMSAGMFYLRRQHFNR